MIKVIIVSFLDNDFTGKQICQVKYVKNGKVIIRLILSIFEEKTTSDFFVGGSFTQEIIYKEEISSEILDEASR